MKIGEIIRQKVREDGRTAKEICDLVGMTRGNLDKIYHKDSVATDLLAAFCEVLKYDFFVHVSPYRAQSNTRYFTAEEENVPFGAEGQGASPERIRALEREIGYLERNIEHLKANLADKDAIIELLKDKIAQMERK